MTGPLPYCGTPPDPGELLLRFNLDFRLVAALLLLGGLHCFLCEPRERRFAVAGWGVAALALMSPLCALSVSLFSARISQHMLLILVAAPLLAISLRSTRPGVHPWSLWSAAGAFFLLLWFWHMPLPYDATFSSSAVYWSMHVSLFGSAVWLWRELLHHSRERTAEALLAGAITSMQMGLLGAVLSLAAHPLYSWHLTTTRAWGLGVMQDQQLGGAIMWVPGMALFFWTSLRSLTRLWHTTDHASAP